MTGSMFMFHARERILFAAVAVLLLAVTGRTSKASQRAKQASRGAADVPYDRYPLRIQDGSSADAEANEGGNLFARVGSTYKVQQLILQDYCRSTAESVCHQKMYDMEAPCGHHGLLHDPAFSSFLFQYVRDANRCEFVFWIDEQLPEEGNAAELDKIKVAFRAMIRNAVEELYSFSLEQDWVRPAEHTSGSDDNFAIYTVHKQQEIRRLFRLVIESVLDYIGSTSSRKDVVVHEERRLSIRLHSTLNESSGTASHASPDNSRVVHLSGHHLWKEKEIWQFVTQVLDEYTHEQGEERDIRQFMDDTLVSHSRLRERFRDNTREFVDTFLRQFIFSLKSESADQEGQSSRSHVFDPFVPSQLRYSYPNIVYSTGTSNCLWSYYEKTELVDPVCGTAMEHGALRMKEFAAMRRNAYIDSEVQHYNVTHNWYRRATFIISSICIVIVMVLHGYEYLRTNGIVFMGRTVGHASATPPDEPSKLLVFLTLQIRRLLCFHILVTVCWWCVSYMHHIAEKSQNDLPYGVSAHLFASTALVSAVSLTLTYVVAYPMDASTANGRLAVSSVARPSAMGYELAVMEVDEAA